MISKEINTFFKSSSFFQPDQEMLEWIVKYAAGRPIIDCGCGNGDVSIALRKAGQGPIIAMDFMTDCSELMRSTIGDPKGMIQFLPRDCTTSKITQIKNCLLLFCRPSHNGTMLGKGSWVEATINNMDPSSEALYITVQANLLKYSDLGEYEENSVKLKHAGSSTDNEIVISVKK